MDRIDDIADLLLGAAYADEHLHDREKRQIATLLAKLLDVDVDALPEGLTRRIEMFEPGEFDLNECASGFREGSDQDKRELLELVAAVHDSDEELDLAEDEFLRAVAEAIDVGEEALTGLALDYEVEELKQSLSHVRAVPPPIPGSGETDIDV